MMNIKTNLGTKILIGSFSVVLFLSCGSKDQKGDEAFERVKAEKLLSGDSNLITKAMVQEPQKMEIPKRPEYVDEQTRYKIETEKKIQANQYAITELKGSAELNTKTLKKLSKLEQENNGFRKQLDDYNRTAKLQWEIFKNNMDHDVDELDIAVKGMKKTSGR